jgi:hypothetical protein
MSPKTLKYTKPFIINLIKDLNPKYKKLNTLKKSDLIKILLKNK